MLNSLRSFDMSRAICILGTHRSGTSLVARSINLLGAYLGEEGSLMRPSEDNPSGYWERRDLYDFHERVLEALSQSWDTSFPLPQGWHGSASMEPLREELRRLVQTQFGGRELWAWKDPRNCLLLPLWKSALAELGVELCSVLVLRNPLAVAQSLERRDGFSLDESFGIWLNYNLVMLEETEGLPRSLVSYDGVMASWETSLRRCMKELDLRWPKLTPPLRSELNETVREDLRHATASAQDLENERCPLPVIELFKLMDRVATKGSFRRNFDEKSFRELLSSHHAYARLHRDASLRKSRLRRTTREGRAEAQFAELRNQLAIRDVRLQDLERLAESYQTRLREANTWFQQLDRTRQELIAEMRLRLDLSEQQATEKSTELTEIRRELQLKNHALLEKEAALQRVSRQLVEKERELETEAYRLRETAEVELQKSRQELKEKSERIRVLEELVREREKVNDLTLAAAASRNHALEALVTQMLASRSWRMTEPLRRAMATLREIRGKLRSERSRARSPGVISETKG